MRYVMTVVIALFFFVAAAAAENGLITLKSAHSVAKTADRLEKALTQKGMTVFIRIDHAQGAKKAGKTLRPTQVVIFGNPKVGTPLMQCAQTVAIDLPQKALIYEDVNGTVWLTYNDPAYLARRHAIKDCDMVLRKISKALDFFTQAAVKQ